MPRDPVKNIRIAVIEKAALERQLLRAKLRQMHIGEFAEHQINLARTAVPAAEDELFTFYGYVVFGAFLEHSNTV